MTGQMDGTLRNGLSIGDPTKRTGKGFLIFKRLKHLPTDIYGSTDKFLSFGLMVRTNSSRPMHLRVGRSSLLQ